MTINLKRKLVAVVFFLLWGVAVSPVMGQQTSATRTELPAVIKFDGDMATMLSHLTGTYGVTVGFEVDPKQPRPQVSFYLLHPTLSDVLNAIVKSAPAYQWRERNGCIEVLPVEASSPLLDVIISDFRVSDVDQTEAVNRLMKVPDVQAAFRSMRLTPQGPAIASTETKKEKFSLNLDGVTMREALSRIASESGGRFWIFRTSRDGVFSISNSPR